MVPPDDAISNDRPSSVDYDFALDDRYAKSDGIVYLIVPNGFALQTVRSDPHYNTFALSIIDK